MTEIFEEFGCVGAPSIYEITLIINKESEYETSNMC